MGEPVVEISDGKLKGTILESSAGDTIYGFLGIPYGKPPVGNLRFKAPLPAEPWNGIRDATKDGDCCYQINFFTSSYTGSEDCLNLNVFTKNISDDQNLKPVLVFLHGGAFIFGSNKSTMYSPNFLLTEDIILVVINHRLGALGFLRLNDTSLGVPGNAGMKDQVLAFKWIQKNIRKFGGDPNNVTIYGQSAGSASVNYHILSPASKGLFHKAIMQSGSVLNPWPHLRPNCHDIVKFINDKCKIDAEILETLLKVPVQELLEAQYKIAEEWTDDRIRTFAPCVEAPNETEFLTSNPIDIITSGDYNKVPMIICYNSNEGALIYMNPKQPGIPQEIDIEYENYVPQQMNLPIDSDLRRKICEKLKKAYSNDSSTDKCLIFGDACFGSGIIGLAENFAKTCPEPVYFHIFSLCTSRNMFKELLRGQEPGAYHCDDLYYIFDSQNPRIPKTPIAPGSKEDKAIKRQVRLWVNFLNYGNPTPNEEEFGVIWKPVTKDNVYYLDIDEQLKLKTNPDGERMELWREIYKSHENTKNFMA